MKIISLYFKNHHLGWEIEPIKFQNLNLLVGLSGAGKSQILDAIWVLKGIAVAGNQTNYVEWQLKFSINKIDYEWQGRFGLANDDIHYRIKTESIIASNGQKIERKEGLIHIIDQAGQTHSTNPNTTPDGLLFQIYASNYGFIEDIVRHFRMMNMRDNTQSEANTSADFYYLRNRYTKQRSSLSLEELRNSNFNIAERLLIAYKRKNNGWSVYDEIVAEIKSIFPSIEEWAIEQQTSRNNEEWNIAYKMKVNKYSKYIQHRNIASGMLRAFNIIADIYLSNIATIFLIDEFENSLGHNCLPNLEELIMEHSVESQFIITSHHPDIINKIPKENWIIVERENSIIRNKRASDLPYYNSNHEPYLILTNHFEKQ